MKELISVKKIDEISPIEGFDRIVRLSVDGKKLFSAKKNGFNEGDYVLFFQVGTFIPCHPQFEWLRKTSYLKTEDGREGFLIQEGKIKDITSDGLALPIKLLDDFRNLGELVEYEETHDVFLLPDQRSTIAIKTGADFTEVFGATILN